MCVYVKYPLLQSEFNQDWKMLTDFIKISQY